MKKVFARLHSDQRGLAIAAALALMLIIAAVTGGLWQALNLMQWAEERDSAVITLPDRAVGYTWSAWGCTGLPAGSALDDYDWGAVVTPSDVIELQEIDIRLGRATNGDRIYRLDVHVMDAGPVKGEYIGSSNGLACNDIVEDTYPSHQPWTTFYFSDPVILVPGINYIIDLQFTGSTGRCYMDTYGPAACVDANMLGYWYGDPSDFSNSYGWCMLIKGWESASPTVYTIGHELNLDGSIQLYGAADVIGDMTCGFLVSDDYDTVVSGSGTQYESSTSGWNAGRYLFDYRLAFLNNDLQYSYAAYASAYGQTWYGDVYNFTRSSSDIPFTLGCDVIENTPDRVWFESSVVGINASGTTTYNLTIAYGTNQTGCQASNGTIAVAYNVTADGIWRTEVNPVTEFDEGTRYFYRLAVAGNDSSLAYSRIQSFTTWDSDEPPWIQRIIFWINDTFGTHLTIESAWWWVVLMLLLLSWSVAGLLKWKWVGVIGTGAIFMWLVVTARVPVWVVILAVLLAGWIIFKLVFTRAHEETGD